MIYLAAVIVMWIVVLAWCRHRINRAYRRH